MSSLTSQSGRSVARLTRGVSRIPSVASVGQQQRGFVSSTRTSTALCANTAVRPSIAASIPVSSVSAVPRNAADQIQIRSLQSDAKDTAWVKKGPVTYEELKPETQAPSGKITIIDVREPSEAEQGMIPSAVNVPLNDIGRAFNTKAEGVDFSKDFGFNRPAFDDKIIVHCRSGKRSAQAQELMAKRGWWNVRNYEGSWLDWVAQEEARGQKDDD